MSKIGINNLSKIKLGIVEITRAYLGLYIVYNKEPSGGTLSIAGPSILNGESAAYTLIYNNNYVSGGTWSIVSGSTYATISNIGELNLNSTADESEITIQCIYNGVTAQKTIVGTYESGTISETTTETETDPITGRVVETITTTVTDGSGNVSTSVTEIALNQDGSYSTTVSESVENIDGSGTYQSNTTNYDDEGNVTGTSESTQTTNSDGSYSGNTINYDENGDPVDGQNVEGDTSGNVNTQEVEYDENGNEVVVGYNIDTSGNQSGGETLSNGLDTGVLIFDGHDWTATLKATILFSNITPASTQFPLMNASSRGDDNKLDGVFFLVTRQNTGMGSAVYDENGTQQSNTTSSDPTLKWRIQSYLGGSLQTGIDFYYNNGTRPYYTNRFGSKTATLTLVYKMIYTESNHQLITEIYKPDGTTIISKPRSETPITFTRTMSDVTFEIGKATNVSGTELKTTLEVLDFNVQKTL